MASGVRITVEIDTAEVRDVFARLSRLVRDFRPVMEEIGSYLVSSTLIRFEDQKGPDGRPWKPSERARRQGGQTLRDTGRLMQSITYRASRRQVEVGTNVIYAPVHQFGAEIRPVRAKWLRFPEPGTDPDRADRDNPHWRFAKRVYIPPRPFLGVDDDDRAEVVAIVEGAIERAVGGAS